MDDDAGGGTGDPELDERRRLDARLVERLRAGDEQAFADIYDAWFDRVHDLAQRIVRDPETAAEVAQDTFLTAWQKLDTLDQPASLGGWLLRIARNRALNRSEREKRSTAVGDEAMAAIEAGGELVSAPAGFRAGERVARAEDPSIAAEDNEVAALLWSAAEALGERDQTVLTLQLRFGMSPAEIGEAMGVNRNAANQLVHRVKGRLDSAVQARVLWDGDRVRCGRLEAELATAGVDGFGPEAVKIADKHAKRCNECGERRRLRLQPAALFGALPLLAAPQLLKQEVAAALAAEGVPVDPSRYAGGQASSSGSSDGGSGGSHTGQQAGAGGAPPPDGVVVGDAFADPASRSTRSTAQAALVAGAAGVLVVLGLVLFLVLGSGGGGDETVAAGAGEPDAEEEADEADDEAIEEVDELPDGPVTTAAPDTTQTTGTSVVPFPDLGPGPDPAGDQGQQPAPPIVDPNPGGGPTPPGPTPQPPPPPADPIQEFSLTPSSVPTSYLQANAPILRWRVLPGYTATIVGIGHAFTASGSSGEAIICPNVTVPVWPDCPAPAATYGFRLDLYQGAQVVDRRYLWLTIG